MSQYVSYKVIVVLVLAVTGGSLGGSTYYYQQKISQQNANISALNANVTDSNNKLSSLSSQLSQLQAQKSQLTAQIQRLQSEITNLTQTRQTTQALTLSKGTILLPGYPASCYTYNESCLTGGVYYINFTVPTNFISAILNVSFSLGCSDCPIVSLLTPSQYGTLIRCNCLERGNYTSVPTTWSSPQSTSYTAQVTIATAGLWILAFRLGPGITNPPNGPYMIDETITLTTTLQSAQRQHILVDHVNQSFAFEWNWNFNLTKGTVVTMNVTFLSGVAVNVILGPINERLNLVQPYLYSGTVKPDSPVAYWTGTIPHDGGYRLELGNVSDETHIATVQVYVNAS